MIGLGTEYQAAFRRQAERNGTEVIPSALEVPYQESSRISCTRPCSYDCQTEDEWKDERGGVSCMMRNRLLLREASTSWKASPWRRWRRGRPHAADLARLADAQADKATRMRRAAIAFHILSCCRCDQALRASIHSGLRPQMSAPELRSRSSGFLLETRSRLYEEDTNLILAMTGASYDDRPPGLSLVVVSEHCGQGCT